MLDTRNLRWSNKTIIFIFRLATDFLHDERWKKVKWRIKYITIVVFTSGVFLQPFLFFFFF